MTAQPDPDAVGEATPRRGIPHAPAAGKRAWLGSLAAHLLVAGLLTIQGGPRLLPTPRVVLPVELPSPTPTATPRPRPKARGDLAVRPKATPSPAPTPTPLPSSTPSPRPTATPTAKPTPKPTARPAAKPTPRPTPDPDEQRRFSQMRRIPYFATMTDAQLRQQRLPPGLKDWGEVAGVTQQLDDLRWLFLPPETGVAGSPAPDAIATDHLIVRWLTASDALPVPSPSVGTDAEGLETTTWQSEEGSIQLARRPGTATAVVRLRPDPLGREPEERRIEVAWDPDPTRFRQLVVDALRALASPPPSASPSP